MGKLESSSQNRVWEIMRDNFPLGHPTELGTIEAPSYKLAREFAEQRWSKPILVLACSRRNSGKTPGAK